MESKTIVLCADDFGLNQGVSQGIIKLVEANRLSAVSCMVNMPDFIISSQSLRALEKQVQIGLHFNLTEGYLLSRPQTPCFSLNELLIKTHLGSVSLSLIAEEFKQQLAQFVQIIGRFPDFIDGHQHVHQFPRVRQVILDLYEQQLKSRGIFIRSTWPIISSSQYQLKARILALTGGKALQAALINAAIPHNRYFSGIYNFSPDTDYRALFRNWLSNISDCTLIMCHPGQMSSVPDVIAPTRTIELSYFLSDEFIEDCNEYGVRVAQKSTNDFVDINNT